MINVCVCVYLVHIHLGVMQPVSLCVCITSLGISLERYKRCVQLPCCRAPPLPRSAGNLTSLTLISHFNKRVYGSQDLVSPPLLPFNFTSLTLSYPVVYHCSSFASPFFASFRCSKFGSQQGISLVVFFSTDTQFYEYSKKIITLSLSVKYLTFSFMFF